MSLRNGSLLLLCLAIIQVASAADRITRTIDNSRRASIAGQVSPRIRAAVDQGLVDPAMPFEYVTIMLKPSPSQRADLTRLLAQQQNPASPNYHRWLTPEQYADRFGVSQADVAKISNWLAAQHLTLKAVARGRNAISFSGTAARIQSAFGIQIHRYRAAGETHFANTADPTIPQAFDGVVLGVHGLHDFRARPRISGKMRPLDTSASGRHSLAPDDIATIYDIAPLYALGIDGTGQTLAVVGQTNIHVSDIETYRANFNLPAKDPTVTIVPGTTAGTNQDDMAEADLDIELSGSIARNADIIYVYAFQDVETALGYAIGQDIAPVVSTSYGICELDDGTADANMLDSWAAEANAQGQTIVAATGDSGAADCFGNVPPTNSANASVDLPAASPGVTGVGGTEFNEGSGSYWNTTNTANQASAKSYIPETAWNDSELDGTPTSGGGGASVNFQKPDWQTGAGVPSANARYVPDLSLAASADHDGYQFVTGNRTGVIGGTSAGAPQLAGIVTLLNHYLTKNGFLSSPGLGNINPELYAGAAVSGVFHDITVGNNTVSPCTQQQSCTPVGYDTTVGYDQATGLGTPDVYNLFTAWQSLAGAAKTTPAVALSAAGSSLAFTDSTSLKVTVTGSGATPTGDVTFSVGTFVLGSATLSGSGSVAQANLSLAGLLLEHGANKITAQYAGDSNYNSANGTGIVTITSAAAAAPTVTDLLNGASFTTAVAPGGVLSIFGANLAPALPSLFGVAPHTPLPTMMAGTSVTINGVNAPLYYVSGTQLNVQVPYETPVGQSVPVVVNQNGLTVNTSILVSAVAPAIFTFDNNAPVPFNTAARGQEVTLYLTGAGGVTPPVATGATPPADATLAQLPVPTGKVLVTVGQIQSPIAFIGIPTWSVGVLQINYVIPTTVSTGSHSVIVSVGGVVSATTQITVTQ